MKDRHGWTLAEVMVSLAVLALLLALVTQALTMTQHSWLSTWAMADRQRSLEDVQTALSTHIRLATLQPRQRFEGAGGALVADSDLHFVCGPAAQLLPDLNGACGDAIFFQQPANEGSLQSTLQVCGFYVRYGNDSEERPAFVHQAPARRRFRLFQYRQAASALTLFQPPSLAARTLRSDLYSWFAGPLRNPTTEINSGISLMAENVVLMILRAIPGDQRCYDTRRYQWEPGTPASNVTRHILPGSIEASLLVTDEASWARLSVSEADDLAASLIKLVEDQFATGASVDSVLTVVGDAMGAQGLKTRISRLTL